MIDKIEEIEKMNHQMEEKETKQQENEFIDAEQDSQSQKEADDDSANVDLAEKYLRLQAEFMNYKKRMENEQKSFAEAVRADFIQKLLPVIDDFDRMIEHIDSDENREHVIEGIKLIHKKLKNVLEEQGLEEISAVGEKFDPNLHEAVMVENHDSFGDDQVIEEWQKGYKLGDRLLRPARVKVNKK